MRPFILLTPDLDESGNFRLQRAYAEAVLAAGGLPWLAPHGADPEALLDRAEGLVVTGGAFDIPPELYGASPREGLGELKPERTRFERALLTGALERGLPVLGICGGMQLINVVRGGTLLQDIDREVEGALAHEQKTPKDQPSHPIELLAGSRLAEAVGPAARYEVNSTHHQAVERLGEGLVASAVAPDGVVEAVEDPDHPFLLGVQWHPESLLASVSWNLGIYRALVRAASK